MRTVLLMALMQAVVLTGSVVLAYEANDRQLLGYWDDLGSTDEGRAARALIGLTKTPEATVAFLKERLQPVKADPARIEELITQLDDDQRARRQEAAEQLLWLGEFARPALQNALDGTPSDRVRVRITEIFENLPGSTRNDSLRTGLRGNNVAVSSITGQVEITIDGKPLDLGRLQRNDPQRRDPWLRATRVIALLESLGGEEAESILERLAEGEPEATPTVEARIALRNLERGR